MCISQNEIYIKDSSQLLTSEKRFIELNYNYAWEGGGNVCAYEFLKYISVIPESVKGQLLCCGFVDVALLNSYPNENGVFERFIDERVVDFEGNSVLAPIWDFVNHSSFAPSFRITPKGVETPPIAPSSEEILFKYSDKNSPMKMWKKYGFAADSIIAYSIPFNVNLRSHALVVKCTGHLGLGTKEKNNFSMDGNILSIKSLPIGCLAVGLPRENFKSTLSIFGLSSELTNLLFAKIREMNIKARRDIINSLEMSHTDSGTGAQLYKALKYEIELIENSLTG